MSVETMNPPSSRFGVQRSRSAVDVYTSDYDASFCPEPATFHHTAKDDSNLGTAGFGVPPSSTRSKKSSSSSSRSKRSKTSGSSSKRSKSGVDVSSNHSSVSRSTASTRSTTGTGSVHSISTKGSSSSSKKRSPVVGVSSHSSSSSSGSSTNRSSPSRFGDAEEMNAEREQKRRDRRDQRKRERERERQQAHQQEQIALQQQQRLQQVQLLEQEIRLQQQLDRNNKMDIENQPSKRRVTFCIGPDGNVGGSVHWFINENYPDLWWQEEELMLTLRACMKTVQELRGVRGREYIKSITRLYHSYKVTVTESQTAQSLQVIANLPEARGLEQHVAQKLRAYTNKQRRQVLEQQERFRHPNGSKLIDFSQHDAILRKEAMKHSRPSRQFAFMIAQYDTHEALQSSLTSWRVGEEYD